MSTTPKLAPTIFLPPGSRALPQLDPDAEAPGAPVARGDAPEPDEEADLFSGVSLAFVYLPLGGAKAARGFAPFALP